MVGIGRQARITDQILELFQPLIGIHKPDVEILTLKYGPQSLF